VLAWSVYVDTGYRRDVRKAVADIEAMSKGVVMLDLSGRPLRAKMANVTSTDPAFKKAIVNYLRTNVYYDWATLTHNYNITLRTLKDLYGKNPDIKEFRDQFFSAGSRGQKSYDAYMLNLLNLIAQNKLPNIIKVISVRMVKYDTDREGFEGKLEFRLLTNWYDSATDTWKNREATAIVEVVGHFDPLKGTPVNPLGIRFDRSFVPTIVVTGE